MKRIVVLFLILIVLAGCTVNIPILKAKGPAYLQSLGWVVDGYEGYQWGFWGGKAWYTVHRKETPWAIYSIYLIYRGREVQFYTPSDMNPKAVIPAQGGK